MNTQIIEKAFEGLEGGDDMTHIHEPYSEQILEKLISFQAKDPMYMPDTICLTPTLDHLRSQLGRSSRANPN